jgi:hypothetical protein
MRESGGRKVFVRDSVVVVFRLASGSLKGCVSEEVSPERVIETCIEMSESSGH